MVLHFPDPPRAQQEDRAIRERRLEHDDTLIEPWPLPHMAAAMGCGSTCHQGRRACDCDRALPASAPPAGPQQDDDDELDRPLRARIWRGYVLLLLVALASAGYWLTRGAAS